MISVIWVSSAPSHWAEILQWSGPAIWEQQHSTRWWPESWNKPQVSTRWASCSASNLCPPSALRGWNPRSRTWPDPRSAGPSPCPDRTCGSGTSRSPRTAAAPADPRWPRGARWRRARWPGWKPPRKKPFRGCWWCRWAHHNGSRSCCPSAPPGRWAGVSGRSRCTGTESAGRRRRARLRSPPPTSWRSARPPPGWPGTCWRSWWAAGGGLRRSSLGIAGEVRPPRSEPAGGSESRSAWHRARLSCSHGAVTNRRRRTRRANVRRSQSQVI